MIVFTANRADYGGVLYVNDGTYPGICESDSKRNCFIQVLAMYHNNFRIGWDTNFRGIYFSGNHANKLGSTLCRGLLDRCAVSKFADVPYGTNAHELDGMS